MKSKQNKKYGIGIAGCGTIASMHAEAIRQLPNVELVSVFSRNLDKARRLGEKFNVAASNNWDEFIGDKRLNIVTVCTPNGTHLDYGHHIAEAGKHVIVEKPIEVTLERGKQLIEICEQHNVKLAVIFQNRFLSEVMRMKEAIDTGELGKVFLGDAYVKWHRTQAYYDSAKWRGTFELDGGGVLINQAIHTIDLLLWLLGSDAARIGRKELGIAGNCVGDL
jgi:predicted dehydrogenase